MALLLLTNFQLSFTVREAKVEEKLGRLCIVIN